MGYLHLNGYAIPVADGGEISHDEIASRRGYSFNGVYQFTRNSLARAWRFRTSLMSRDELVALAGMLNMQGDGWRWDIDGSPNGVHYIAGSSSSEGYSDMRRVQKNTEAVATVCSAYGSDGSIVRDWNGNLYAPFYGCQGSLMTDPGTTNKFVLTTSGNLGSGSVTNPSAAASWEGTNCISNFISGTSGTQGFYVGDLIEVSGGHTLSAYVKFSSPLLNRLWRTSYYDVATGFVVGTTVDFTPTDDDVWYRVYTYGAGTVGGAIRLWIYTGVSGGTGTMYIDGIQWETNVADGYPTAYVGPSDNPWGSGNGIRPAGVLDYNSFISTYTNGITISAWVNFQRLNPGGSRYIFDSSDTNPRMILFVDTSNRFRFLVFATSSSLLDVTPAASAVGIHHLVATYDPRDSTARLYIDGTLAASDSSWSGSRRTLDIEKITGDLSIGSTGTAGTFWCPGPIGPVQLYPFVATESMIAGLYNAGSADAPVPGVMPLGAHGGFLGAGEKSVKVYTGDVKIAPAPHVPESTGQFDDGGGRLSFTMVEAVGR